MHCVGQATERAAGAPGQRSSTGRQTQQRTSARPGAHLDKYGRVTYVCTTACVCCVFVCVCCACCACVFTYVSAAF